MVNQPRGHSARFRGNHLWSKGIKGGLAYITRYLRPKYPATLELGEDFRSIKEKGILSHLGYVKVNETIWGDLYIFLFDSVVTSVGDPKADPWITSILNGEHQPAWPEEPF